MKSGKEAKGSLLERGLRWDVKFQRRLGHVAVVVAGGLTAVGLPVAAGWTAAFAAGNYVTAEVEDRMAKGLESSRAKSAKSVGARAVKAS